MVTTRSGGGYGQSRFLYSLKRAVAGAVLVQVSVMLCAAGALAVSGNGAVAVAVLLGGGISLLPNLWFAARVLLYPAPLDARQRVNNLYLAEIIKLVLGGVLFALVFTVFRHVPPAWVLGAFVLLHLLYLVVMIMLLGTNRNH